MKLVYHPRYCEVYASDPAASPGRMEAIWEHLEGRFPCFEPLPATKPELLLAHTEMHVKAIQRDEHLYEIACLAVGGAVLAAQKAAGGEPCFGLVRPPGHHASPGHCWGFCYFNNLAVSLKVLMASGAVRKAAILDFDLHFGDGTESIFCTDPEVVYLHPEERTPEGFLGACEKALEGAGPRDILAVSAGFDRGRQDWGDLLAGEDYRRLGEIARQYAEACCGGRRFAVLEGGYNHRVLGQYVYAFLEGFG